MEWSLQYKISQVPNVMKYKPDVGSTSCSMDTILLQRPLARGPRLSPSMLYQANDKLF